MIIYKYFDKQYFTFIPIIGVLINFSHLILIKNWLIINYIYTFPITLHLLQWFPTKKNVFGSETFACLERILNPRANPLINFSELIGCLV